MCSAIRWSSAPAIGIAMAPADGNEPDQLLRNADMALYRAKADGRGTYHFFQPEMDAQMQERRKLELDLRKALLAGRIRAALSAAGRGRERRGHRLRGAGALESPGARPGRRPTQFIPVAEEIGLIVPLGDWVLKQACRDAATWPGHLTVAVNLSAVQFRNPTLALSVVSALGQSGLAASRLELEITESVLLQDDRAVLDTLHQIPRARRADLHGRFRHRLFVAELSAQLPLRQDQDRPLLHPRTRQEERLRRHHPRRASASARASA